MKLQRKFIAIVLFFICYNGFSQVNVTTNFRIQTNLPIDTRMVVADVTALNAISSFYRYEGLLVYVIGNQTNYQLVGGITNANWQTLLLTGSVYSAGTGLTLSGNTFSHSPHSGDVTGTTSLTITAIQGRTLATITPTSGDVITWNGSAWAPAAALGTQYVSGTGIILAGNTFSANTTASIWNASQLQGKDISVTSPLSNEVLKWDGTAWSPSTDINTFYSAGTGLTLSGTTFTANNNASIWNASKIQGQDVSATPPNNNQILKWNGTIWTPVDEIVHAAGTGLTLTTNTFSANTTSPIWNANQLMGSALSTTAPSTNGQLLKWNSASSVWEPGTDANFIYSAGTGLALTGNTFSIIGPVDVSLGGTGQTNYTGGQLLIGNTAGGLTKNELTPGTGISITNGNGIITIANTALNEVHTGDAIGGTSLTVVALQGRSIETTTPTSGNVLGWNGSTWTPVTDNNNFYAAGTGITLTGSTFSADNTTPIWNANQIMGSPVSTTAPNNNQLLKWNSTEWVPADETAYTVGTGLSLIGNTFSIIDPVAVNLGGSGQSSYTDGQLLIGNTSGGLTKNVLTSGSGISITNGDGVITIANNALNEVHTGDAIGGTSLTVIALQGRTIETTAPTSGNVLGWNGSAWTPVTDNNNFYAAGTGITLTGSTFSADNTSAIWNANQIMGSAISTTSPSANGQLLKWNSANSEWEPGTDANFIYSAGSGLTLTGNTFSITSPVDVTLGGTGQTTYTGGQLLIGNTAGGLTKNVLTPGSGISITNGDGVITITNTDLNEVHTGDAIGGTSLTVIALQGRNIETTSPTSGNVLGWNGSSWTPVTDNNNFYAAGTGITLSGSTFSADNTTPIWNANQLNGSTISTIAPALNEVLKWDGSEWVPVADAVNTYSAGSGITLTGTTFSLTGPVDVALGGTGQTTYTDGQLLIGNTAGGLTKNVLTPGSGISITNGDGVITITNTDLNATHTGDAIGASAITVVGLQGRAVATTIPTNGDVLTWNSISSDWVPSQSSNAFNGNKPVKRATWPYNVNMGTTTNVTAFLNAVFFPFLSASISMNNLSVLYEIGTSNSVTVSGTTTVGDETLFSNGRVDQTYPSTTTVYTFGAATSYSTSITFTPDQSVPASLELRFVAYQGVDNNGSPTTINSSIKYVRSCYPFLHGVNSDNLTTGGTATYTGLTGKIVGLKANQTVSLTGSGYIYFCYPASYGNLTSILDHNPFEQISAFTKFTVNVTSSGLTNNWTESYYIYQSNSQTTPAGWNYQFKF